MNSCGGLNGETWKLLGQVLEELDELLVIRLGAREEVHPALVKGVVDLEDHGGEFFGGVVEVPERDGVEVVPEKLGGCDEVGVGILGRVDVLVVAGQSFV